MDWFFINDNYAHNLVVRSFSSSGSWFGRGASIHTWWQRQTSAGSKGSEIDSFLLNQCSLHQSYLEPRAPYYSYTTACA